MRLAANAKREDGEIFNQDATVTSGYDVDWATGTIWSGVYKGTPHKLEFDSPASLKSEDVMLIVPGVRFSPS